uniref:Uncharacterized protein n=1 Tax=Oryza meridionalis TaxID=40149 RepID=A0A0E0C3U1_9ORYZ
MAVMTWVAYTVLVPELAKKEMSTCSFTLNGPGLRVNSNSRAHKRRHAMRQPSGTTTICEEMAVMVSGSQRYQKNWLRKERTTHDAKLVEKGENHARRYPQTPHPKPVSSSVLAKLAASMPVTRDIVGGARAGSAAAVLALLVAAAGGDELAAAVGSSSSSVIMPPCFHACFDQCVQREEYWFCQFSCYRRCGAGATAAAAGRFSGAGDCEHACALSMCGQIDPGSKMMAVCRDTCGKSYAAAGCRRPISLTAAV